MYKSLFIVFILVFSIFSFSFFVQNVSAEWWDTDWNNYVVITINHSYIEENLVNFPVLVVLNDTIGDKCNGGDSIRFLSTDNQSWFYYEIEKWVDNEDRLLWVNISEAITSGSDYKFLMYYNNAGAGSNESSPDVWDGNYKLVYHCNEASGDIVDSSGTNVNGTPATSGGTFTYQSDGMVGYGINLTATSPGTSELLGIDSNYDMPNNLDGTIELWWYPDSLFSYNSIFTNSVNIDDWEEWETVGGNARFRVESDLVCDYYLVGAVDEWVYVVSTWDFSTPQVWQYFNTIDGGTDNAGSWVNPVDFGLGAPFAGNDAPDAGFDELRISNIIRNTSWINATYYSISANDFMSISGEHSQSSETPPNVVTNEAVGIEETNATISGTLSSNGSKDTTCWLVYGNQTPPTDYNVSQGVIADGASFSYNWSGLDPGSMHYFLAEANNSEGWDVDGIQGFITKPNDPSSLTITPIANGFNISWTHGAGYNTTLLRYKTTGYPTSTSDGIQLTKANVTFYEHTSLSTGTYYYRIWEYSNWDNYNQYSDGNISDKDSYIEYNWYSSSFGGSVEIYSSNPPVFSNPSAYTDTTGVSLSTNEWNITIKDDGGVFDWSIETSPNIGNNSANGANNGSKVIEITGLTCNTNYTIFVNATDNDGRGGWTRETFWFETEACPTWYSSSFGGSVEITGIAIDVSLNVSSWIIGSKNCGVSVQKNFTFYQNGSANLDINIGVNDSNLSFVNYSEYGQNDEYCANFTIYSWSNESMIEPGYLPSTILKDDFSPGNFVFGLRIWMPVSCSVGSPHEDFEVIILVVEHT